MKRIFALLLCVFAMSPVHAVSEPQELLDPDQAFALSVRVRDAETIEASWKIAKGYYMYRDKFRFESLDPALTLKPAVIPAGKKKEDPSFGVVETYTNAVAIRLPIGQRASGAQTAKLRITAQGCNEPVGVCYPPMVKELSVAAAGIKGRRHGNEIRRREVAQGPDRAH